MRSPLRRLPRALPFVTVALLGGWAAAAAQQRQGPPPRPVAPLWGFADLHAHPATFLAFGADDDGNDGLIYGSPGMKANHGELQQLLPCDADKHAGSADLVTDGTQVQAFTALDGSTGANHTSGGWPTFDGWPSARSLTHQQMHVDWLYRAWQGGLRLMVASATDNKLLSAMWHNALNTSLDWDLSVVSDYFSATKQLDYITRMVKANASWMGLARNPGQAEGLIRAGKLAVVLRLEMDDLTTDQILALRKDYGVTVVNPIHVADNASFGGAAVYSDLFDTFNRTLWGEHYQSRYEPTVGYRLGAPLHMDDDVVPIPLPFLPVCFLTYVTTSDHPEDACSEGLDFCHLGDTLTTDGSANAVGLNDLGRAGLLRLWKEGMIVDLAHMSDLAQQDTLAAARRLRTPMPVIDSHTDLRADVGGFGSGAITERKLLPGHAQQIAFLGGMIGLGTEGDVGAHTISREQNSPLARLAKGQVFVYRLDNPRLRIGIGTADDGLDYTSRVHATVTIAGADFDAGYLAEPTDDPVASHLVQEFRQVDNHSVHWATLDLPPGTTAASVQKLRLDLEQHDPNCSTGCDNWKVDRFEVYFVSRTAIARLYSAVNLGDPYLHQFRGHPDGQGTPWWELELAPDGHQVVDVEMVTGNDAVDDDKGWMQLHFTDGTSSSDGLWGGRMSPTSGTFSGLYFERPYALPDGEAVTDIDRVALGIAPGVQAGCNLSCDNWDLQSVRVSQPSALGTRVVLDRAASPAFRFTGTDPERLFAVRLEIDAPILPARLAPDVQWLQIAISTETDDLQRDNEVTGVLHVDGITVPSFSLNQGAKWFDGTTHLTIVQLPQPVKVAAIRSLDIIFSGPKSDDWKIGAIEIQTLGTPIRTWYDQYQATLGLMNGRGVGIGTDLNGLNPQVPFSEVPVSYPLGPPTPPTGYAPLQGAQQAGSRTFDFQHEGISNVGELPEFLQSVEDVSGNASATLPLFHSANDFVEMWKKVEAAASALP